MDHEVSIDIDAPAAAVWPVIADVKRWPEWTASVTSIELLDGDPGDGALRVGTRVRIKQPRLVPMTWTVTEVEPGRSFTWTGGSGGVTTEAGHRVAPTGERTSRVTLTIHQTGLLAPVVALLFGGLTRRYLAMEATGLKQRAESQ